MRVANEDDGFSPSWNFVCLSSSLHLLAALETPSLQLIKRLAGIKSDGENMPERCRASALQSLSLTLGDAPRSITRGDGTPCNCIC